MKPEGYSYQRTDRRTGIEINAYVDEALRTKGWVFTKCTVSVQ